MGSTGNDNDEGDVGDNADGGSVRDFGMSTEHPDNDEEYHSQGSLPDTDSPKRSSRRGPLRQWADRQLPAVGRWLVNLLWKTCRVRIQGAEHIEALVDADRAFIPSYWHGHQLFSVRALLELRDQRPEFKLGYLISPSRDGDAAARVFADLDLHVIRGSASRGGAQALREIYQAIRRDGVSPIVTPDGPRGPCHEFKPGVAMLASLAGAPVVPLAYAARPAIPLTSWDKSFIPLPFARVQVVIGPAMEFPRGLEGQSLQEACDSAGGALAEAAAEAEQLLRQ